MESKIGKPAEQPCEAHKYYGVIVEGPEVRWEDSRTAYYWDGKGEDPNRPVALCRDCAQEHHAYWSSMWAEYFNGLM